MLSYTVSPGRPTLHPGLVVAPADELIGVPTPGAGFVASAALGPGLVEKVAPNGRVRVRWMDAGFAAWMDPADLRSQGEYAHLISVYHCDGQGQRTLDQRRVVDKAGLSNNWTIERRPDHIIRAVRGDGAAWTFRWFPETGHLETLWPQPPEDADAEALTAVEHAVMDP